MVSQLQRAKNSFSQNAEELKKQLEEENKVSSLSLHQSVVVITIGSNLCRNSEFLQFD